MHILHIHVPYLPQVTFVLGWLCGGFTVWEFMAARERAVAEIEDYANEG